MMYSDTITRARRWALAARVWRRIASEHVGHAADRAEAYARDCDDRCQRLAREAAEMRSIAHQPEPIDSVLPLE